MPVLVFVTFLDNELQESRDLQSYSLSLSISGTLHSIWNIAEKRGKKEGRKREREGENEEERGNKILPDH